MNPKYLTFWVLFSFYFFVSGISWGHNVPLGSMQGVVDGKIVHITIFRPYVATGMMLLPASNQVRDPKQVEADLRRVMKFWNNGTPCQINVKSVQTIGQDEEIVLDVVCEQTAGSLSMHSEYMVDKGYQFNVIMSKGGEVKGSLLIGADNTDAVFNLETSKEKLLQFMNLGLEHIYTGYDHMLFVLALILVSPKIGPLIKTVTAFTVAHSITLILSTLNILTISSRFVEPMIAFSIAFVAFGDLWNSYRCNKQSSLHSHPKYWLIAFGFGLVHGLAFAGGLKQINIPQSLLIPSLLLFNVGVEIAQISIIAVVFPVLCFLKSFEWQPRFVQTALLLVGSMGSVWLVERVYLLLI